MNGLLTPRQELKAQLSTIMQLSFGPVENDDVQRTLQDGFQFPSYDLRSLRNEEGGTTGSQLV